MWGSIVKIFLEIFGGKASTIFAIVVILPMLGGLVLGWNAWLDSRDEAAVTKVMYQQEQQTSAAIAKTLEANIATAEADQITMLNLNNQKEASDAVAMQAKLELKEYAENETETKCGKWSTTPIPAHPRRVLLEYIRQVQDTSRLYGGCAGTPTGCAAARLRDAIDGTIDKRVRVPGKGSD